MADGAVNRRERGTSVGRREGAAVVLDVFREGADVCSLYWYIGPRHSEGAKAIAPRSAWPKVAHCE